MTALRGAGGQLSFVGMNPFFVHLKRHLAQHLLVAAEVSSLDGTRVTDPLTFIVDTACERTLIVPDCKDHVDKICGPLRFDTNRRLKAESMVGPIEFETEAGFCLHFLAIDGEHRKVVPLRSELCFTIDDSPLGKHGAKHDDPESAIDVEMHFNILGRDVLNQATLIVPPGAGDAFMIFQYDIRPSLRKILAVRDFLDARPPEGTRHETIPHLTDDQVLGESASTKRFMKSPKKPRKKAT